MLKPGLAEGRDNSSNVVCNKKARQDLRNQGPSAASLPLLAR